MSVVKTVIGRHGGHGSGRSGQNRFRICAGLAQGNIYRGRKYEIIRLGKFNRRVRLEHLNGCQFRARTDRIGLDPHLSARRARLAQIELLCGSKERKRRGPLTESD